MNLVSIAPQRPSSSGRTQYQVATSSDRLHRRCHKVHYPVNSKKQWETIRPRQEGAVKNPIVPKMEKPITDAGSSPMNLNEEFSAPFVRGQFDWPPPPPLVATPVNKSDKQGKTNHSLLTNIPTHVYFSTKSHKKSIISNVPTDGNFLSSGIHEDCFSDISDMSHDNDLVNIISGKKQKQVQQGGVKTQGCSMKLADSSTELLPCLPLSKFHRTSNKVTHDSSWGITTIQLDDNDAWESRDDYFWPSDEEDKEEKRQGRCHSLSRPCWQHEFTTDDCKHSSEFIGHGLKCDHAQGWPTPDNSSPMSVPTKDIFPPQDFPEPRSTPKSSVTIKTASTTTGTATPRGINNACRCQRQRNLRKTCSYEDFLLSPTYTTTSTTEASSFEMDISLG
jgi:hypothetical protein